MTHQCICQTQTGMAFVSRPPYTISAVTIPYLSANSVTRYLWWDWCVWPFYKLLEQTHLQCFCVVCVLYWMWLKHSCLNCVYGTVHTVCQGLHISCLLYSANASWYVWHSWHTTVLWRSLEAQRWLGWHGSEPVQCMHLLWQTANTGSIVLEINCFLTEFIIRRWCPINTGITTGMQLLLYKQEPTAKRSEFRCS